MDNFIVSARKYRPQTFRSVVGQTHITSTLRNAILNRQLAQAYLFCGPRGVGKTTCARIFAKTINCQSVTPEGEACDKCVSCISFNDGAALNVYELDAASNNSVDGIRELVNQVRIAPQVGEYKVYVIDEVHMLSNAAFNAFLKTLEEPPRHAKFILATTEKHKIIPTILSRCQVFNFNRIKTEDIAGHLAYLAGEEKVNYEPEALNIIAQKADGGLRDACSIFDQMVAFTGNDLTYRQVVENLHVLDHDYYFRIVDLFLNQSLPEVMLVFDEILKKGFDAQNFITGLGEHLRNLMVSIDPLTTSLLEGSESLRQKYAEQAQRFTAGLLMKSLAEVSKADINFRSARNQRLLVEMMLMQLCFLKAPAEAEKKNNEPVENLRKETVPAAVPVTGEPEPRFTRKPSITFDQLKIKSSFSLNEAMQQGNNATATAIAPANVTTSTVEESTIPARELTATDVTAAVHFYADEKLKLGARQLATSIRNGGIAYENDTITLKLHNESQREVLQTARQDLLDSLRKSLGAPSLAIEIVVEEVSSSPVKAWKPAEVFKDLASRNPALLELRRRFDLEIDY